MRLPRFVYLEPSTLKEAMEILSDHQSHVIKAGGTDLIPRLKRRLAQPKFLINLKGLSELDFIRQDGRGTLQIGALTTLRVIESSPLLIERFGALSDAVARIATAEIRNVATLGGNICLDTRCQFYNQSPLFRQGADPCLKAGGSECYIFRKGSQCHGLFCADTVPLLIAADAKLRIVSSGGERLVPLQDFYSGDGKDPFFIGQEELVAEVHIPESVTNARAVYLKSRFREAIDFPLVGIAVLHMNERQGESLGKVRVVVGGASSKPVRCVKVEELLEKVGVEGQVLEEAAETAVEEVGLVSFSGCSIHYRKTLVKQLLIRAVKEIMD